MVPRRAAAGIFQSILLSFVRQAALLVFLAAAARARIVAADLGRLAHMRQLRQRILVVVFVVAEIIGTIEILLVKLVIAFPSPQALPHALLVVHRQKGRASRRERVGLYVTLSEDAVS